MFDVRRSVRLQHRVCALGHWHSRDHAEQNSECKRQGRCFTAARRHVARCAGLCAPHDRSGRRERARRVVLQHTRAERKAPKMGRAVVSSKTATLFTRPPTYFTVLHTPAGGAGVGGYRGGSPRVSRLGRVNTPRKKSFARFKRQTPAPGLPPPARPGAVLRHARGSRA